MRVTLAKTPTKMLKALLGLLYSLASYFANKQLIDAGEAKEKARNSKKVLENVSKAQAACNRADDGIRKRLRDRYKLDK